MNMFYGTVDEINDEDSQSLHRSRSSQDVVGVMSDIELDQLSYEQRMIQRRGAIRKPYWSTERPQRRSVALPRESPLFPEVAGINEFTTHTDCECRPSQVIEHGRQKQQKNSLAFWKSLKSDGKNEEICKSEKKPRKSIGNMEWKSFSFEILSEKSPKLPNKNPPKVLIYTINDLSEPIIRNKHPIKWISEESWTEIVNPNKILSKTQSDLQAAIWELITTEVSFLNFLWLVVEIFQPVFYKLQETFAEMERIDAFHIFGNIHEIYRNNIQLWETCVCLPVVKSRLDHEPLDILLMKSGFLSISSTMSNYVTFMKNQIDMSRHIQRLEKYDSVFKEYVGWTRSYSKLQRDGVSAVLSTPFQRITKYKLLLDRIKSFASEDQYGPLDEMINSVHNFLDYMDSVVSGEKRLEEIQSKLVIKNSILCDIHKLDLEGPRVFDLTKSLNGLPERILIHDGQLKLVINHKKKCDVQCYLFNDLFLICKPVRKDWSKFTIFKSPIRIDKLIVKEESESSFMAAIFNDFLTVDTVLVFIGEGVAAKLWIDKCTKTRMKYMASKKITNTYSCSCSKLFNDGQENDRKIEFFSEYLISDDTVKTHLWNGPTSGCSSCSWDSVSQAPTDHDVVCQNNENHHNNTKRVISDLFASITSEDSSFVYDDDNISLVTKQPEEEQSDVVPNGNGL